MHDFNSKQNEQTHEYGYRKIFEINKNGGKQKATNHFYT